MDDYRPIGIPTTLLEEGGENDNGAFDHKFNNVSLKTGAIIAMYDVGSEDNKTNLGPEYDVMVIEQRQDQGQAGVIYKNVLAPDAFGSIADFLEYRRRVPDQVKEYRDTLDPDSMNGAFVMLLCIDGQSENAIIIGGIRNPNRPDILTDANGRHLEWEFNGVNFVIKDDGSVRIEYKSATDNDGKYEDEAAGGSYLEIDKSGKITITDGNKESIVIDKDGKTIALTAESDISATTDANANITAQQSINLTATADLIANAQGKAAITSGSQIDVEAASQVQIKSPMQKFSADSMFMVESNLVNIKGSIVLLGQGGPPALTLQTQFLGVSPFFGLPVISVPIGPFSTSVFFS